MSRAGQQCRLGTLDRQSLPSGRLVSVWTHPPWWGVGGGVTVRLRDPGELWDRIPSVSPSSGPSDPAPTGKGGPQTTFPTFPYAQGQASAGIRMSVINTLE